MLAASEGGVDLAALVGIWRQESRQGPALIATGL